MQRYYVVLGQESQWAAEACECAADQDAYWPFIDALYANQARANTGGFSKASLKRIGAELGLGSAFGACVDSGKYAARIRASTAEGARNGVTGTPTLFINGVKLDQPYTYESIREAVERAAR